MHMSGGCHEVTTWAEVGNSPLRFKVPGSSYWLQRPRQDSCYSLLNPLGEKIYYLKLCCTRVQTQRYHNAKSIIKYSLEPFPLDGVHVPGQDASVDSFLMSHSTSSLSSLAATLPRLSQMSRLDCRCCWASVQHWVAVQSPRDRA